MSIQLFVLSKCASTSLSGLPAYLGLKWDQFNCGLCGASGAGGAFGIKGFRGDGGSVDSDLGVDSDLDPDLGFD